MAAAFSVRQPCSVDDRSTVAKDCISIPECSRIVVSREGGIGKAVGVYRLTHLRGLNKDGCCFRLSSLSDVTN